MTHVLFLLITIVVACFGELAKNGDFPFYAIIERDEYPYTGGAILTTTLVILPAHCLVGLRTVKEVNVYVGFIQLVRGTPKYEVKEVIFHKSYNRVTRSGDIAFLIVKKPFEFNLNVAPVKLARYEENIDRFLTLVGYQFVDRFPDKMESFQELEQDIDSCETYFYEHSRRKLIEITNNNVCTYPNLSASKGSDTYILLNEKKELVGIANHMLRNKEAPHVFTLLQPYKSSIKKIMKKYP